MCSSRKEKRLGPGKKKGRKNGARFWPLVDRLKEYKASVCLFIKDFAEPFDNNQAERVCACPKLRPRYPDVSAHRMAHRNTLI